MKGKKRERRNSTAPLDRVRLKQIRLKADISLYVFLLLAYPDLRFNSRKMAEKIAEENGMKFVQSFLLIRRTFVIHGFNYRKFRFPENTRIPRTILGSTSFQRWRFLAYPRYKEGGIYEKIEYRETVT